jgi:hypothetical protein
MAINDAPPFVDIHCRMAGLNFLAGEIDALAADKGRLVLPRAARYAGAGRSRNIAPLTAGQEYRGCRGQYRLVSGGPTTIVTFQSADGWRTINEPSINLSMGALGNQYGRYGCHTGIGRLCSTHSIVIVSLGNIRTSTLNFQNPTIIGDRRLWPQLNLDAPVVLWKRTAPIRI